MNKRRLLIVIGLLLVIAIGIGVSYAYYLFSVSQQGVNVIRTDCFELTYEDEGQVVLNNAFPIRDSEVATVTPYHFKIKNICNQPAAYQVNLDIMNTSNLDIQYLNYKLDSGAITALSTTEVATPTATGANGSRVLTTGNLLANEEKEYDLRVWLKESVTTSDPVENKTFKSKIVVIASLNKELINAANTIRSIVVGADTTSTDVIGTTGLAYDGTVDNNLRYVGANPNNYVSFNNELWRIIGVMNNIQTEGGQTQSLVKIVRKDKFENLYSWDTSESSINSGRGVSQWGPSGTYEGADLMRELNTDYLGNVTVGTDGYWFSAQGNVKESVKPVVTLSNDSQLIVESVIWNLGAANRDNGSNLAYSSELLNAPFIYSHERLQSPSYINSIDNVTRTSTWIGKVALIYASDYMYATAGGSTVNRASCLGVTISSLGGQEVADCKNNNWIYESGSTQWTLSPLGGENLALSVDSGGEFGAGSISYNRFIRPSLYLKSTVKITGGTGTQADPYTLGL